MTARRGEEFTDAHAGTREASWRSILRERGLWICFGVALIYTSLNVASMAPIDTDEELYGLAAFRILEGESPIWVHHPALPYGGSYIGALKSYLDAPLVAAFGPSDLALRATSIVFRMLHLIPVFGTLLLMLGRRAALGGTLIQALLPLSIDYYHLSAMSHSLNTLLWYCAIFSAAYVCRFPTRNVGAALALGLASGLALWNTPQTLLMVPPAILCFLLATRGVPSFRKGVAGLTVAFLTGSAPWWYFNLLQSRMGTFHHNHLTVAAPMEGSAETLITAMRTWFSYAIVQLHTVFTPAPLAHQALHVFENPLPVDPPWVAWYVWLLQIIILGASAGFVVVLFRRYGLPLRLLSRSFSIRRNGPALAESDRQTLFWWCAIAGSAVLWFLAAGFTAPGISLAVRYLLPMIILLPLVLPLVTLHLLGGRDGMLRLVAGSIALLALIEVVHFPQRLQVRRKLVAQSRQILDQIKKWQARYIAGDWWDAGRYRYWTGEKIVAFYLDPTLKLEIFGPPPATLEPGPGLLILKRGSRREIYINKGASRDLVELKAPPAYRLFRIPTQPQPGFAAELVAAIGFRRFYERFQSGESSDMVLNQGLHSNAARRIVGASDIPSFVSDAQQEFLVFGPYVRLHPGLYEVEFKFEPPQPIRFTVSSDVTAEVGETILARQTRSFSSQGGSLKMAFEVPYGSEDEHETRLFVEQSEGPVVLSRVLLRRLATASTLPRNRFRILSAGSSEQTDFLRRYQKFQAGRSNQLILNSALSTIDADRIFDDGSRIVSFRSEAAPGFMVFGPYLGLRSGRYEVEFVFPSGQPRQFKAWADVAADSGDSVLARTEGQFTNEGGVLKTSFEVPLGSNDLYETRLYLERADGPVTLSRVLLRRAGKSSAQSAVKGDG